MSKIFFPLAKAALLSVFLLPLALAACSSSQPQVEEEDRILVLPFDYPLIPAENAARASRLRNMLATRIVYVLQGAGVPAELYMAEGSSTAENPDMRLNALEAARKRDFDYLVAGSIALERVELAPAVKVLGVDRSTAGAEVDCTFQLISVEDGSVTRSGAVSGRDSRSVSLRDERRNDEYLAGVMDKVLQESVNLAALRVAEALTGRRLGAVSSDFEVEEERAYYQDSPGKRLKPVED
ncbi:MAG: hypothetical protein LBQ63_02940 [Deltaproteobacteria bacterium]|jgi:hypothetical protein|nr:hypothetical protein [Deltaproteobacteria bacterium]